MLLSGDLLSWIEFHPERLSKPQTIIGITLMVLGLIVLWTSPYIAKISIFKKWSEKDPQKRDVNILAKIVGMIFAVVGCIVACI
jgi:hypothetical protein